MIPHAVAQVVRRMQRRTAPRRRPPLTRLIVDEAAHLASSTTARVVAGVGLVLAALGLRRRDRGD